jgi:hypothetical protein
MDRGRRQALGAYPEEAAQAGARRHGRLAPNRYNRNVVQVDRCVPGVLRLHQCPRQEKRPGGRFPTGYTHPTATTRVYT